MRALAAVAVLLVLAAVSRADVIKLKSGEVIEGDIVAETEDSVTIRTGSGTIKMTTTYRRDTIESVTREETPARRAEALAAAVKKGDPASYRAAIAALREVGRAADADRLQAELDAVELEAWKAAHAGRLCPECKGDKALPCKACGGKGSARVTGLCETCRGTGRIVCPDCRGAMKGPCRGGCFKEDTQKTVTGPDGKRYDLTIKKGMILVRRGMGEWYQACPKCNMTGVAPCETCRATGQVACPDCQGKGVREVKAKCAACEGKCRVPCAACGGTGLKGEAGGGKTDEQQR